MIKQYRAKENPKFYMDPDSYDMINTWEKDRFLEMFVCAICYGVVINPIECTTPSCTMLYCEKCIEGMKENQSCPRRCGSATYRQPNKHLMKHLNEMKFKCQNHPWCPDIVPYSNY